MRIIVTLLMYGGTFYYLDTDGVQASDPFDFKEQVKALATVFGNTVFVFIFHHSISGIVFPIRP